MARPLLAYRLKHRITIQEPNMVDNGRGGRRVPDGEDKWRDVATRVHAEVIPLRGDEALRLGIERRIQLWRVTTRPRAGVTAANRVVHGAIAMDIKAAALNAAGDELVMTCESGAGG